MKKKSIFVVLPISMLLISVVLTSCAQTAASGAPKIITSANTQGWSIPPASYTPLQVGGLAPDFAEVDVLTGKFVTIKQFAGKTVLLNFVNYGCSSAVNNAVSAQLLAIQKLAQTRSDFVPVSVFCGCCPKETLKQFAQANNLSWPWVLDSGNTIVSKYSAYVGKYAYPTLVFIDQNGKIYEATGAQNELSMGQTLDKISANVTPAQ